MSWRREMPFQPSFSCAFAAAMLMRSCRTPACPATPAASALARLPRLLSSLTAKPDLAIVELGANDVLRGMPLVATRANLHAILSELAPCGIPALIASIPAPRLLGAFATACDAVYADLAAKHRLPSTPFIRPACWAAQPSHCLTGCIPTLRRSP